MLSTDRCDSVKVADKSLGGLELARGFSRPKAGRVTKGAWLCTNDGAVLARAVKGGSARPGRRATSDPKGFCTMNRIVSLSHSNLLVERYANSPYAN